MPSTCEVTSDFTRADTEAPHAASIAAPAVRTGGEVMTPWARTVAVKAEAVKRVVKYMAEAINI